MPAAKDLDCLSDLSTELVARCRAQPYLDDFLQWQAGTLEYWLHILLSGVGRSFGWSARTEIPYITESPSPSSKSKLKWADGAVIWPNGLGALIEVKAVPARETIGKVIEHVANDLAALLATAWRATLTYQDAADHYTDPDWWIERSRIERPWGLQVTLVHGIAIDADRTLEIRAGLDRGMATLRRRSTEPPTWLAAVEACIATPLASAVVRGEKSAAVMMLSASPIAGA